MVSLRHESRLPRAPQGTRRACDLFSREFEMQKAVLWSIGKKKQQKRDVESGVDDVAFENAIPTNFYGNFNNYQNYYYFLTHTRCAPWFIGLILGYYIFKLKQNEFRLELNKLVVLIIWGVCLGTMLVCSLGGYRTLRGEEYDRLGNAFHIALVRPAWSVAISWVILACISDYGGPINWVLSLPIHQVLNRFSYCIYLIHVTILYMIIFDQKRSYEFSNLNMAFSF
ncbi:hypothetical protein MTP99_005043 [Tenebrio molitor]|nr:hypothetical protein MTP99_005043 [Tenebrio molitor]